MAGRHATREEARARYMGKEFTMKCGSVVKVVHYRDNYNVTVQGPDGESRVFSANVLKQGCCRWVVRGKGRKGGKGDMDVGNKFRLRSGVDVVIVESIDAFNIIVEDSEKNRKSTNASRLRQGTVGWGEFTKTKSSDAIVPVAVGDIFTLHCGTVVTVTCTKRQTCVRVVDSSGNLHRATARQLRLRSLVWPWSENDSSKRYYVYFVWHQDEVVYIGKGSGTRCSHVNSGRSHVYELNRLHFAGEVLPVTFFKQGMSEDEAFSVEAAQIQIYNPQFNTFGNSLKSEFVGLYPTSNVAEV